MCKSRRLFWVALLLLMGVAILPTSAQATGVSVTCENGASFDNGVEVRVVQMRSGFTYVATAVGLNGFDPVLAVLDANGRGLCTDDSPEAAGYSVNLPTSGSVRASGTSAQIRFAQTSGQALADVSLVVGGFGNSSGEFILILEGMAVTQGDGAGDPFSLRLTQGMVDSGIPLSVYMVATSSTLDPYMRLVDGQLNDLQDGNGAAITCDDMGAANLCWSGTWDTAGAFISRRSGQQIGLNGRDALLALPLVGYQLDSDPDFNFLNFLMTSYQGSSTGEYLLAFHMGIGASGSSGESGESRPIQSPRVQPTVTAVAPPAGGGGVGGATGVRVTCENGASFDNGVEVRVVQMRSGFTYVATAVGLNGFDPVLAVLDANGRGLCTDDSPEAAGYSVNLPTSGSVRASGTSAQIRFAQTSGQALADVSLVVGGFGNSSGEFILILEGMAVTQGDGAGDPFSLRLTQGMVDSGIPLSVYMVATSSTLDPYMRLVDGQLNDLQDGNGAAITCDDMGAANLCWSGTWDTAGAFISRRSGQQIGLNGRDALLALPLVGYQLDSDPDFNFLNFLMTSYQGSSTGEYLLAFHAGTR